MINNILKKIEKANEVESSKVELAKHDIELGLVQDIEKDLNTWYGSAQSVKQALNQLRSKVIKDNQELKLVEAAIDRVQQAAAEIGADNVFKQTQELRKKKIAISQGFLIAADNIAKAIEKLP